MSLQKKKNSTASPAAVDRSVISGISISFGIMLLTALIGGALLQFIDILSFLLVVGGTIGATLVNFSYKDIAQAFNSARKVLTSRSVEPSGRMQYLMRLAQAVRSKGLLLLEKEAQYSSDSFLRMAFDLVADGHPTEEIKRILETERRTAIEQASRSIRVFESMGSYAPPLGLIGTLIGLIEMLRVLDDPLKVGPAMSLALVTTLYGAVLANLILLPLAGKLRLRAEEEALIKALTIEATVSLSKQDNALLLEQKLQSYLPAQVA